ncbi:MAG TPA: squalene cyclase [Jatrophihabitans sp.]|jgi:hypothetical protein
MDMIAVPAWLLESDPAVRWQALRDLTDAPADEVAAARALVATEGWGARLLAVRDPDGRWAGGACFPADFRGDFSAGQPWTSTLPSLALLRDFGVDPGDPDVRAAIAQVAENCRWEYDDTLAFFDGEVEPCINGRTVAIGAYFGVAVDDLVARLLGEQLADGGWNCEAENGSVRSSFHSTICVLEGLLEYDRAGGAHDVGDARERGEQYLLERRLFRRLRTGEVADQAWLQFSFPTQWHYDVLRGLDHFRAAGGAPDERIHEALDLVRSKRGADGTWPLENTHPGAMHFALEDGDGRPSRWNTLRAKRVLAWAEG